jgi:hypothetical protein
MRAMRISSQDPPTDSVDTGDIHLGGEPPGKENDSSFGVNRYLIHILISEGVRVYLMFDHSGQETVILNNISWWQKLGKD